MAEKDLVKVRLVEAEYSETLWASRVGGNRFRLENSPFWAYGVSFLDIVEACPDIEGMLEMTNVISKTGHRTVRIVFEGAYAAQEEIDRVLAGVNSLGATFEGMNRIYVSVDIPPDTALAPLVSYLTEQGVNWEYADPTYEQVKPEDRPVSSRGHR